MQILRQKVGCPLHTQPVVFVYSYSHHWDPGNNFDYMRRKSLSLHEEPPGRQQMNKQADHPINNSASFQEGRTAQDTYMNHCKVLALSYI